MRSAAVSPRKNRQPATGTLFPCRSRYGMDVTDIAALSLAAAYEIFEKCEKAIGVISLEFIVKNLVR